MPFKFNLQRYTAVAAVTEHIGGVLPSHVNFNIPRGRVEEDWLWSVGAHPFSATAAGTSLVGLCAS